MHQHYGRLTAGTHVSPYLIDAMVALARDKWALNETTLFCDGKDAFLQWPQAGQDIIAFCQQRELRGIPTTEPALLTMLMSAKVVHGAEDGMPLREIAGAGGEIVLGIKLLRPGLVIEDMDKVRGVDRKVALSDAVAADPLKVQPVDKQSKTADKPSATQTVAVTPTDAATAPPLASKGVPGKRTPTPKPETGKPRPTLDIMEIDAPVETTKSPADTPANQLPPQMDPAGQTILTAIAEQEITLAQSRAQRTGHTRFGPQRLLGPGPNERDVSLRASLLCAENHWGEALQLVQPPAYCSEQVLEHIALHLGHAQWDHAVTLLQRVLASTMLRATSPYRRELDLVQKILVRMGHDITRRHWLLHLASVHKAKRQAQLRA